MAKERNSTISDLLLTLVFGFGVIAFVCFIVNPKNLFWAIVIVVYAWGLPLYLSFRSGKSDRKPFDVPRGPDDFGPYDGGDGDSC